MAKDYHLKIGDAFGKPHLKVYILDLARLVEVQFLIRQLISVEKVNVTSSRSDLGRPDNLTVYPRPMFEIGETYGEVATALELYFSGGICDPAFIDETVPLLGDPAYFATLDYILQIGSNLERSPRVTSVLDEEALRDYLVLFLNCVSRKHTAVGEAFNKAGRTDILIQSSTAINILVAECKVWSGAVQLTRAVDQLITRYVTWRDEKLALIVFNKDVFAFSEVIQKATDALTSHPLCLGSPEERKETSFSYDFRLTEDPSRKVRLELVLFNFQAPNI